MVEYSISIYNQYLELEIMDFPVAVYNPPWWEVTCWTQHLISHHDIEI